MNKELFIHNRTKIFSNMLDNSVLVSFSIPKGEIKHDVNRNYFYLCGNFEFENIVMLVKKDSICKEIMFINPYDEFKAKWVGAPLSKEAVFEQSGIKDIRYLNEFDDVLKDYMKDVTKLYVDLENDKNPYSNEKLFANKQKEEFNHLVVYNSQDLFKKARTIKHKIEIDEIKKAIEITNKGILNILDNMKESYEYQLESYFDQAIKYHGGTGYAFTTIAASGGNACCLHYQENNQIARDGDLILFDLGASHNMYCADISRTFPVNGKFSDRQKQIYNIVLAGQQHVLEHTRPGITTKELNQKLVEFYAIELKKIGLINEDKEVMKYYYHGVSHLLGLDCHDLCEYTPLEAGAIITCEPGLYIAEENIGIRIEDDILITEDGYVNLSSQIIKTVEEIENYLRK